MRWIPPAVIGIVAGVAAFVGPMLYESRVDGDDGPYIGASWWGMFSIIFYVPFLIAVVGGTAAAFRALWLSTRRAQLASELALGTTRRGLVGAHARAGLREGVLFAGVGTALGAIGRQVFAGFGDGYWNPSAVASWLFVVGMGAACLTAAYASAASWMSRGSVRDVATGAPGTGRGADARNGRPRLSRRARLATGIAVAVLVVGLVLAALNWAATGADETPSTVQLLVAIIAGSVMGALLYLGVPGVLAYLGARASAWGARRTMQVVASGSAPGSARSLAADALSRPTPMRTGALLAMVAVMGVATAVTAITAGNAAREELAVGLQPAATVSAFELVGGDDTLDEHDSGWVEELPSGVLDSLRADPDLIVVEAGVLLTDLRESADDVTAAHDVVHRDVLVAVRTSDAELIEPLASVALQMAPGSQWTYGTLGWTAQFPDEGTHVEVNGERRDTRTTGISGPWSGVERGWAESVWGEAPTAAALVYGAGAATVSDALARHALDGLVVTDMGGSFWWSSPVNGGIVAAVTAPFLAIAVAIVIALAWSTQRLRARDQATLLALGATASALRRGAALEAFVATLIAAAAGTAGGLVVGTLLEALNRGGFTAASAADAWAGMSFTVAAIPWSVLITLVLGAAVLAAAGAALVRLRLDRLTPAQQLTEAQKAGIS